MLDVCSRRSVGWSITDHMRTELVVEALKRLRGPVGRWQVSGCTRTMACNTLRLSSRRCAVGWPWCNRWVGLDQVPTMRWLSRSMPR
ncbi:hypothetical protein [Paeniglutamicibacter sp. Y32M11]|uniref:hypothetical protein n=1 Tax=Paeniglutamicibacter sp. Y32M11 TaxID=2853258 RepID=UPI00351CCFBC